VVVLSAAAIAAGLFLRQSAGGSGRSSFPVSLSLARPYLASPRGIPLLARAQIQLDVGRPLVAPETIDFPPGL
jgi:hypothetical protein